MPRSCLVCARLKRQNAALRKANAKLRKQLKNRPVVFRRVQGPVVGPVLE